MPGIPGIRKGVHGVQFVVCAAAGEEQGHLAFSPVLLQFFPLLRGKEVRDILLEIKPQSAYGAKRKHQQKQKCGHPFAGRQPVIDMQDKRFQSSIAISYKYTAFFPERKRFYLPISMRGQP